MLVAVVIPFVAATVIGLLVLWPDDPNPPVPDVIGPPAELADASVTAVERRPCEGTEADQNVVCQQITARLTSGAEAGETVRARGRGRPVWKRATGSSSGWWRAPTTSRTSSGGLPSSCSGCASPWPWWRWPGGAG
ncbi:MAG: hypothetical protein ACRD0O_03275 [Acidimicrobiia bacterium]